MANQVQVGDVGTIIELTVTDEGVAVDLSSATILQFSFQAPNGTAKTRTAILSNDGTDGKLRYATIAGDIDQAGTWRVQAVVTTPSWSGRSSLERFTALRNA